MSLILYEPQAGVWPGVKIYSQSKFPMQNLEESLEIANKIINNKNFNNNIIDLRISNQLILSNE